MISLTGVTHPPLNGGQSALEADGLLSFCAQVYGDSKETSKKKSRRPSKALKEKKRRSTSSTKSASKARKKKLSKKRKKRKKRKKKRKKRKKKGLKAQPALKLRQLTHSYERSLKRAELKGARVAWLIVDGSSGEVISSHQPELKLHPASNTKIATTAAAYVILSPDFTYETQWYTERPATAPPATAPPATASPATAPPATAPPATAPPATAPPATAPPSKFRVDMPLPAPPRLYWKGSGDPKIVREVMEDVAKQISRAQIKRFKELIIDDSDFTTQPLAPGYEEKPEDDAAYRAAAGAVGYNFNSFITRLAPGAKVNDLPKVSFEPAVPYFRLDNQAKTSKRGKEALQLTASAEEGHMRVFLGGKIPRRHKKVSVRRRIAHPLRYSGEALISALKKVGVTVTDGVRRGPLPPKKNRLVIATHRSSPLRALLSDVNYYSNNYMAEQTLLTLGFHRKKFGGWTEGLDVARSFLSEQVGLKDFTYVNGSGLFGQTRFSPRQMVKLLRYMKAITKDGFAKTLPAAGAHGTLRRRMKGIPKGDLRAKTGTLDGVSAISGYIKTRQGAHLVFSVMMNDLPGKAWEARSIQDEMLNFLWLLERPSPPSPPKREARPKEASPK